MRLLMRILLGLIVVVALFAVVMHFRAEGQREGEEANLSTLPKTVSVSSRSFPPNGDMPVSCSCKGKELSPALIWETNRTDVQAYVILATDYDAPSPRFPIVNLSHWVVYNLPASVRSLPEGVTAGQMRMLGGKIGKNSTGNQQYVGPCPPVGRHAYVFRVYALDGPLTVAEMPDRFDVLDKMKGHILGYGELIGYFQ